MEALDRCRTLVNRAAGTLDRDRIVTEEPTR